SLTQLHNNAINRYYQAHTNNRALAIQVLQSIEPDLSCIFCRYQSNVPLPRGIVLTLFQRFTSFLSIPRINKTYTNQYDIYIDQPNYTLLSTSHIDNLETTESTPSQPIQSTSSETIIDIDSTSTPLESDNLNTETSQTIHNISTSTIEIKQDQTTTFYSVPPSPVQILDSRSAPVSPIIPLTLYNISSSPPNILLFTSTANHWSSVAINRNIEQSSSSSYTLLYSQLDTSNNFSPKFSPIPISTQYIYTSIYPNISDTEEATQTFLNNQSDSDSEQSFGKAYTAILNQVRTLNNNTDNQNLFSNYPISDEESNSSDTKQLTELDQNQGYCNECYQDINKLTLPNNPEEGSSNSFTITTE
ncbi:14225_t:CDS:2, partial [Gigaspora margarita]